MEEAKENKPKEFNWEVTPLPKPSGNTYNIYDTPAKLNEGKEFSVEITKKWFEDYNEIVIKLNKAIEEHLQGKKVILLKSRRPGFSLIPPKILDLQKQLSNKFRGISTPEKITVPKMTKKESKAFLKAWLEATPKLMFENTYNNVPIIYGTGGGIEDFTDFEKTINNHINSKKEEKNENTKEETNIT